MAWAAAFSATALNFISRRYNSSAPRNGRDDDDGDDDNESAIIDAEDDCKRACDTKDGTARHSRASAGSETRARDPPSVAARENMS